MAAKKHKNSLMISQTVKNFGVTTSCDTNDVKSNELQFFSTEGECLFKLSF
jgi:hypothetical protein